MVRRTFLQTALALPLLNAQHIEMGDPSTEWRRSKPDFKTYLPKGRGLNDGDNEHFLVFDSPAGDLLALWTQSSIEGAGDNHLMLSRSTNLAEWTEPRCIAGPYQGSKDAQASWGFPIVSKKGRIYVFYCQDSSGPERDSRGRTLKINDMAVLFSDDDGKSWNRGADVPWPKAAYDHPMGLGVNWNWIVYQIPIRDSKGRPLAGYSYWVSDHLRKDKPAGWWVADSGSKFMRFDNIDDAPDPKDLHVTHLMLEGKGLTTPSVFHPELTDCEEPSLVLLPDNRLFVTMRTSAGYVYYSVSEDDGASWRPPEPLRYKDDGDLIPHPKAPCPIYRLKDGRYLHLFFNNAGTLGQFSQYSPASLRRINHWSHIRRPLHITVGEFRPSARQPIWFSRPKQLLDTDGVIVGPKKTAEIATYTSLTESKGQRVLWYPDRKFYLLGKALPDELLRDMVPAKV